MDFVNNILVCQEYRKINYERYIFEKKKDKKDQ